MPKTITRVAYPPKLQSKKKVAAYCRVSSGKDAMLHSLSAQVSYYNELIQKEATWEFIGVYSDEALTGTKDDRAGFQRLITDCKNKKIDMVITKSISRFARNTVTLLEVTRMFKEWEVDIYFEEQNIHTMGSDGELMLTILASYAQEESLSVSENQKWRIKKNFEEGKPWNCVLLGYRYVDDRFVIEPKEAETIRFVFEQFLQGDGLNSIAQKLNKMNVSTRYGKTKWHKNSVKNILSNYTYTGNMLLQKTFSENHISKAKKINNGEKTKYLATETHEAIISVEVFQKVQEELQRRADCYAPTCKNKAPLYPFSYKLQCYNCGKSYWRKIKNTGVVWTCSTFITNGKASCASKSIPESTLMRSTAEAMGLEEFDPIRFEEEVDYIEVHNGNILVYCFKDGRIVEIKWKDRSRSESWTPEMRAAARKKSKESEENKKCHGQ